ncbi:MAG: hypothetical protein HOO99_00380 [Hyphomicrobiaceae bacterium]|nr:hypothetical protein [Hyphomicrobiaceae bacterium]
MKKQIAMRYLALASIVASLATATPSFAQHNATDPSLGTSGRFQMSGANFPACLLQTPQADRKKCLEPLPTGLVSDEELAAVHIRRAKLLLWDYQQPIGAEAEAEVDAALRATPNSADVLHFAARLTLHLHSYPPSPPHIQKGAAQINAALAQQPNDVALRNTLAHYAIAQKQPAVAFKLLSDILKDKPDDLAALTTRSVLFVQNNAHEAAVEDLNRALIVTPNNPKLRLQRASVLNSLARPSDAIADLDVVLSDDKMKHDIEARMTRATAYRQLGNFELAVKDMSYIIDGPGNGQKFVPLPPHMQSGLVMQRGMAYFKLGRTADAMRDIETSVTHKGTQHILKLQITLRQHGYSAVKIDGKLSDQVRDALQACFAAAECGEVITSRL